MALDVLLQNVWNAAVFPKCNNPAVSRPEPLTGTSTLERRSKFHKAGQPATTAYINHDGLGSDLCVLLDVQP